MARIYIFTIIIIAVLSMAILKPTNAFFMDSTAAAGNVFAAAATFPSESITPSSEPSDTPTPTISDIPTTSPTPTDTLTPTSSVTPTPQPGDLVINEVAPFSAGADEWVELYNKSSNTINITGWKLNDITGGDTFSTTPPIPPGGFVVIIAQTTNIIPPISATTIQLANTLGNGGLSTTNETLSLLNPDNTVIDALSWGSNTSILNPAVAGTISAGTAYSRNPNGINTNTAADWILDLSPSIGIEN